MKLYYAETFNPRKVCAVARYLNSPVTFVSIDLGKGEHKTPEFLAMNPNGLVPVLVDGDKRIWESNAIMCYLAERAGSDLWPHDERQFEIIRWLSWDLEHFSRHTGELYFQHLVKPHFGLGEPDAAAIAKALSYFTRYARILDDHLKGRDYLVGDSLTIADFAVAAGLPYADSAGLPLDEFSEVRRWSARLDALPAWRDPYPAPNAAVAAA